MKKIGLLISLLLVIGFTTDLFAQRAIKNGFSITLNAGTPRKSYGVEDVYAYPGYELLTTWGLQLGNRWYIAPQDMWGVGIMVNWVDFTMGARTGTLYGIDWLRTTMDMSFAEVGPVGTFAINDDMGIDAYYNLRPTLLITAVQETMGNSELTSGSAGFGFGHAIGTAFRWKVLNVGFEYNFGGIRSTITDDTNDTDVTRTARVKTNCFRVLFGVKF